MSKKLLVGVAVVIAIGFIVLFKRGASDSNNPLSNKNEIKVGQDVCGEFPKEWVQSVLGKPIIKAEKSGMSGTYVCQYFVDANNFVTLRLNELNYENQKKGQQTLGRTIVTNEAIQMNHFVAMQGDKVINEIVLEISPNLILAVDRSSLSAANETEIVRFAIKVTERIRNRENQIIVSVPSAEPTKQSEGNTVPLPQDKDIINSFFQLIDEGKPSDAVMMMTSNITGNDSTKQGFAVQYNAMDSVKVKNIEEAMKESWTDTKHEYMVTLDVVMNPSSAGGPIPYYGFERGDNIRFVTLIKEGNLWKVEGLGTGP